MIVCVDFIHQSILHHLAYSAKRRISIRNNYNVTDANLIPKNKRLRNLAGVCLPDSVVHSLRISSSCQARITPVYVSTPAQRDVILCDCSTIDVVLGAVAPRLIFQNCRPEDRAVAGVCPLLPPCAPVQRAWRFRKHTRYRLSALQAAGGLLAFSGSPANLPRNLRKRRIGEK